MAPSNPATVRSRALGALAVLVLALLISLALFVGRGVCTSGFRAIARDDGAEVGSAKTRHDPMRGAEQWCVEVPIGPTISIAGIVDRTIRAAAFVGAPIPA